MLIKIGFCRLSVQEYEVPHIILLLIDSVCSVKRV